jgi:hypothetical protein
MNAVSRCEAGETLGWLCWHSRLRFVMLTNTQCTCGLSKKQKTAATCCLVQNATGKAIPGAVLSSTLPQQTPAKPEVKPLHSPSKPVIISVNPPKAITMADWDALLSKEVAALCTAGDKLPEEFQCSTKKFARYAGLGSSTCRSGLHVVVICER